MRLLNVSEKIPIIMIEIAEANHVEIKYLQVCANLALFTFVKFFSPKRISNRAFGALKNN